MGIVEELKKLIEKWNVCDSPTGDPSYDMGIENGQAACADNLEEILEKIKTCKEETYGQNHKAAQLIASAPELLETLELITFYFSDSKRQRSSDPNYINIARAAIAKAKGRANEVES